MASRIPYEKKKMNIPEICIYEYQKILMIKLAEKENKKPSCLLQEFIRAYFRR